MDRRTFLKTSSAAAAATAAASQTAQSLPVDVAPPNITPDRHEIVVGVSDAMPAPAMEFAIDALLEQVRAASDGTMTFRRQVVTGPMITALQAGDVDAALVLDGASAQARPDLALFTGLPGRRGLSPEQLLTWMTAGGGDPQWQATLEPLGLIGLLAGHTGRNMGFWSRRPLEHLGDLRGTTVMTSGLGLDFTETIGAKPITSPADADVREVAANVTMAAPSLRDAGFTNWYRDGLHANGHAATLLISLRRWEKLGAAHQATLHGIASANYSTDLAQTAMHDREVAPALFKAWGLSRRPLANEIASAIDHATNVAIARMEQYDVTARQAVESYDRFALAMTGVPLRHRGTNPADALV